MTGLDFVQSLFYVSAMMTALLGVVLVLQESGLDTGGEGRFRGRLSAFWIELEEMPWGDVPARVMARFIQFIDGIVRRYFTDVDRSQAFNALYFGLLFIGLPLAALVNAVFGGSPVLIYYYLALAGIFFFLNLFGEIGWLRWANRGLAFFSGLSILLVIPAYVLRSFSEVTFRDVYEHGVLTAIPVAFLWYVSAYGVMRVTEMIFPGIAGKKGNPFTAFTASWHLFLFLLPAGFILVCLALFAGYLSVNLAEPERPWLLGLSSMAATGLCLVAIRATLVRVKMNGSAIMVAPLMALGAGFALAAALSIIVYMFAAAGFGHTPAEAFRESIDVFFGRIPGNDFIFLGPEFWAMHVPLAVPLVFLGVLMLAWLAKGLLILFRQFHGARRPYLVAGALCWIVASGLGMLGVAF